MAATARATMDFFAAQAAARRRTWLLVVWFALAWAGTIALAWAALALLLGSGVLGVQAGALVAAPEFLPAVAGAVTLVTACGSAWHGLRLAREGPLAVVQMVGGVPVDRATTQDAAERRLANVVEEMAIAAGIPVPALYLLPREAGINAFAAGFTPDRAAIAVTRGALDALSRDELQGVVAHEFSHLLNADAKLNLRLVAVIGGITALAFAGRILVRGLDDLEDDLVGRRRHWRGGGGRFRFGIFAVGLCLWMTGALGAFFGRVIRAGVSRQREFLADAAAVQFTRNPDGLAGALSKIAEHGSRIDSAGAPEVSHLFFANGLRSSWLATHPPLDERIRRISPAYFAEHARAAVARALAGAQELPAPGAAVTPFAETVPALAAAHTVVESVGNPGPAHVAWAAGLLARLPPDVAVATRHAPGARALATALLLDRDPVTRELQLAHVAEDVRADAGRLAVAIAGASREERMAVLDLALPSLDGLARNAAAALVRDLAAVASADGRTTVFEWAVLRIVRRRLARALGERRQAGFRPKGVDDVQVEVLELLSTLAWLGARDTAGAQAALDAATAAAGVPGTWRVLPRERARASAVDAALERLDGASIALKGKVLAACAACALADGKVVAAEGEIARAVAASLGLPMPPLSAREPARIAETA